MISAIPSPDQSEDDGQRVTIVPASQTPRGQGKKTAPVGSARAIYKNVEDDDEVHLSQEKLEGILADLEEDGDIERTEDGWQLTKQGVEVAAGDNAARGGRDYYGWYDVAEVEAAVENDAKNAEADGS